MAPSVSITTAAQSYTGLLTVTGTASPGTWVDVQIGSLFTAVQTAPNGTWSASMQANLPAGTHTVTATAVGPNNILSSPATKTFTVVVPAVPAIAYPVGSPQRSPSPAGLPTAPPAEGFIGSQWLQDLAYSFNMTNLSSPAAPGVAALLSSFQNVLVIDNHQDVLVNVRASSQGNLLRLEQDLKGLGMQVTSVTESQQIVTGYLPIARIDSLPTLADYGAATPVYAPHVSAAPMSQGDHLIGADTFRATTGKDGSGVAVGVLSDSVNADGGLAADEQSGALPAAIDVLQDGSGQSQNEGRAMLELVHDSAPGAALAFSTAEGGPQAMAAAIQNLAQQAAAKVIVDDVQYPDEPFFNDGVLAQTVDQVAINNDVVYVTAAGNNGNNGWQAGFKPVTSSVGGVAGTFADVSPTGSGQTLQHFSLQPGQTIDLSFQWDAAFLEGGSTQTPFQVPNEMDVLVTDGSGQHLLRSFNDQTQNTGEALQRVFFTNDGSFGTNNFALSFRLAAGPAPTELKWVRFDSNAAAEFQGAPTIFGHAAARNALTVAAVPWNAPNTPEAFTSQGKATILFDTNGSRLSQPELRTKPDVTGPDGVATATFPAFYGTSAAAATLAASAALLRAQSPANDYWATILNIEHKAVAVGAPGWSPVTGFGLDPLGSSSPGISLSAASWTLIGPAPVNGGQIAGAGPVSGRVTGIAVDPGDANVAYLTAAGGGVWKTTDGGVTWTPKTDQQSTLFMGAIAVAPSNTQVVYAGTGEANNAERISGAVQLTFYGRGVLKSSDGGTTWTLENDNGIFDRKVISRIVVDPKDANTVYVAIAGAGVNGSVTGTGSDVTGIYKSTDGGVTWTNTTTGQISGLTGKDAFTDLVIDPNTPANLYLAIGDPNGAADNGIYESTDSGATWKASGNAPAGAKEGVIRLALFSDPSSATRELYAAATDVNGNIDPNGPIYATQNPGNGASTTWAALAQQPPEYFSGQGFYDSAIAVNPTNQNEVFVAGSIQTDASGNPVTDTNGNFLGQVWETTDGGTSKAWADVTNGPDGNGVHPDHHALAFDADGNLLDGNDGGVYRLNTTTLDWADQNASLSTLQPIGLALHPTDPNTAYIGTQDNGTNKFGGSLGWTQVRFGDGGFVHVDPKNPNTVYHTFFNGGAGFLERSTDGGATWTAADNGINPNGTDNSEFYPPYVIDQTNPSRLILGTDHVYETTDQGNNWTAIGTPGSNGLNINTSNFEDITAVAVSQSNPKTIYVASAVSLVGGSAHIFVTTDDGATWTQRDIPNIQDHIQTLLVDPSNSQTVYAVRDRFGQGKVFKSTDGGQTWTDISSNLPDLPAYGFALDPNRGTLFVGTDNAVYASADGGVSWALFGTGLPNAQARDLEFNASLGILAAGTHGRSVWEISVPPPAPPPPPPPPPPLPPGGGAGGIPLFLDAEQNQTSDTATPLGVLVGQQEFDNLGIEKLASGVNDYDWFRWTAGTFGTFSAAINVTAGGDLELHVFTLVGNTLTELGNTTQQTPGTATLALSVPAAAGQVLFVEVKGKNSAPGVQDSGDYNLIVNLQ